MKLKMSMMRMMVSTKQATNGESFETILYMSYNSSLVARVSDLLPLDIFKSGNASCIECGMHCLYTACSRKKPLLKQAFVLN